MLKGRTAVITGGTRGIGRAIALEFAAQGADLALIYSGNADSAHATSTEAEALGVQVKAYHCDVSSWDQVQSTSEQILADFGRVDILVNNAGIVKDNLAIRMSEQDFDQVVAVNLKGAFTMIRHLSKSLLTSPYGRIINVSSVVGLMGNIGQANYSASKAGLIGMTKSLAREFASRGVTCNVIAPGFIDTDMTTALPATVLEKLKALIPLKTVGRPEDIAHSALFLASDMASYITGEVLQVDGGMRL